MRKNPNSTRAQKPLVLKAAKAWANSRRSKAPSWRASISYVRGRPMADFEIVWWDDRREPKVPPDPAYPDGIDLDLTNGNPKFCESALAHPTPRCGKYYIKCRTCGLS